MCCWVRTKFSYYYLLAPTIEIFRRGDYRLGKTNSPFLREVRPECRGGGACCLFALNGTGNKLGGKLLDLEVKGKKSEEGIP